MRNAELDHTTAHFETLNGDLMVTTDTRAPGQRQAQFPLVKQVGKHHKNIEIHNQVSLS